MEPADIKHIIRRQRDLLELALEVNEIANTGVLPNGHIVNPAVLDWAENWTWRFEDKET